MKNTAMGILAHVDSGKTTLSESMLYTAGVIKSTGRVDKGDAFLDTDKIEKERGITVFSKQAVFEYKNTRITLLDTPGHAELEAEAERTLKILDCAVLIVSGTDGVQSHTKTLWHFLEHYKIPTFVFINKTDLATCNIQKAKDDIQKLLGGKCVDFCGEEDKDESIALCDTTLMEEYFEKGKISENSVKRAIKERLVFPCFCGSALKNIGTKELMDAIDAYAPETEENKNFGARVFKITDDGKGNTLSHLKITGGTLNVKDAVEKDGKSEKINEIRIYSGAKYQNVTSAECGTVCAVTGLSFARAGMGLGFESDFAPLLSEAVFNYGVILPKGYDSAKAVKIFNKLALEETQMNVTFDPKTQKIGIKITGDIQLEIIKRILEERYGLHAEFESGGISYRETIATKAEGVGHFEPLRHYAEVHLMLEPAECGSGITVANECDEDTLPKNYQNLIISHIYEKTHLGVLTGSPITDIKITLLSGKAHAKHTEGGDFRQATYRAIRQGLMQAKSILLEPRYAFSATIPTKLSGRILTELEQLGAESEPPKASDSETEICGKIPAAKINEFRKSITNHTHGSGTLSCFFEGYFPSKEQERIVESTGYNAEADTENTPDSVFCYKGSGTTVKWSEVFEHMHLPLKKEKNEQITAPHAEKYRRIIAGEEELLKIFEATYGKVKTDSHRPLKSAKFPSPKPQKAKIFDETYLLIDGYNIIFAWDDLKQIASESPDAARAILINRICNYKAMRDEKVILVFDAYKVEGGVRETEQHHGVSVIYTKEAETADTYIEKTSKELSKNYRVRVATSDRAEQIIVFGNGAYRISAEEFEKEVKSAEEEMRKFVSKGTLGGEKW